MDEAPAPAFAAQHPVRLHVTDDLRRTRLTAFFRLLLAVPLFLWAALVGIFVALAAIGNWFVTLIASFLGVLAGYAALFFSPGLRTRSGGAGKMPILTRVWQRGLGGALGVGL